MVVIDPGGDVFTPGDPPHGVCIAPNDTALEPEPTWVRLDDPANDWRLRVSQVSVDRGKSNELDTTKTGTASVTFHDPEGILDPTNTTSEFYDIGNSVTLLDPNVQFAFARWNPVAGTWSTRFRGFTKQWSYEMDTSGFSTVTLEAVDLFELLADLLLTPGDQGNTPPVGGEGDIYYEGGSTIPAQDVFKHVDQRIIQILTDAGLPGFWWGELATPPGIFSGNVTVQEQTIDRLGQALEALLAAADAEFPGVANVFCRREGWIQFFGRYARFFPDRPGYGIGEWDVGGAAQAEADANVVRLTKLSFRRSKDDIFNVALALPQGLEDGDVPGQQVEDATSIAKYGRRPWGAEDLLTWEGHDDLGDPVTAADETKKFATYRVANYKDPKNRIEQIEFKMLRVDHHSGPAVWSFLSGVEIGDVLNVDTTHRGGGGFDEPCYVEGIREVDEPLDGTMHNVTMEIDVSPKSFFASNPFGEVDDGVTNKVLKVDCAADEAWVSRNLGVDAPEVWVTYKLAANAAAIAFWTAPNLVDFAEIRNPANTGYSDTLNYDDTGWTTAWAGPAASPPLVADTWMLVEQRLVNAGASELYLDGSLVLSGTNSLTDDTRFVVLGQISAFTDPDAVAYFDDVKVGTTRGDSDLFSDTFQDGTLAAWTSTFGAVSIVNDPF